MADSPRSATVLNALPTLCAPIPVETCAGCVVVDVAWDNWARGRVVLVARFDEFHPGWSRFAWCPVCCTALFLSDVASAA